MHPFGLFCHSRIKDQPTLYVDSCPILERNKQWYTPSFHKQENCRRHQSSWSQTTVNKSTMRCLQIQMWSVWCGLCWLYSPTPFPTHWWTQALSYWKTPAWLSQSGEQRPHWTIHWLHYTEEMSWEIWMLDLRNAFYPGKETQTEHSIRLNKSETI